MEVEIVDGRVPFRSDDHASNFREGTAPMLDQVSNDGPRVAHRQFDAPGEQERYRVTIPRLVRAEPEVPAERGVLVVWPVDRDARRWPGAVSAVEDVIDRRGLVVAERGRSAG